MHNRARIAIPVIIIALLAGSFWWYQQQVAARSDGTLRASGTVEAEQVLVTAAVPADMPESLMGTTCRVEHGAVERVEPLEPDEPLAAQEFLDG